MPPNASPVLCPHCGSAATLPLPGLADKVGSVFGLAFGKTRRDLSFANPDLVRQFQAGAISAVCTACRRQFRQRTRAAEAASGPGPEAGSDRGVVERLRELEHLRAEHLISESEYQAKRAEILRAL